MVVKDFCFPNGVQIKHWNKKRANNILYGQQTNIKENSFVFTLQAQDMNSYDPNVADEFIYCIVTIFEEIVEGKEPNTYFTSQKAMCIMAKYRHFDIYLSILAAIINLYKLERYNILQKNTEYPGAKIAGENLELMNKLKAAT